MSTESVPITSSDTWDLIRTIALSQSQNPLRCIKELVDNALGAGATQVVVEIRKKGSHKKNPRIVVRDNGVGWNTVEDKQKGLRVPDLWYTAKNIAQSIKIRNDESKKRRDEGKEVGQFGIGMLSFWGLGHRLTVTTRSRLPDGQLTCTGMMAWKYDNRDAEIEVPYFPSLKSSGTEVVVDQLIPSQLTIISGKYLAEVLSKGCGPLLMRTGAELIIDDHGEKIKVLPRKFEGMPIPITTVGGVEFELFIPPNSIEPSDVRVSVFRMSEKVMDDVSSRIPELDTPPWNDASIYGTVNYPEGNVSPDRSDFINDLKKAEFIEAMKEAGILASKFVADQEEARRRLEQNESSRLFREKWETILRDLPETWARSPRNAQVPGIGAGRIAEVHQEPGPLNSLDINPAAGEVVIDGTITLKAVPKDSDGNSIKRSMYFGWEILGTSGKGQLTGIDKKEVTYKAPSKPCVVAVRVSAVEGDIVRATSTNIIVSESIPEKIICPPPGGDEKNGKGRMDAPPSINWFKDPLGQRSHYIVNMNQIEFNEAHPDYLKAKSKGIPATVHYENMCYSREIVLDRWQLLLKDNPREVSERMIELLVIADDAFGFGTPELRKRKGRRPKPKEKSE